MLCVSLSTVCGDSPTNKQQGRDLVDKIRLWSQSLLAAAYKQTPSRLYVGSGTLTAFYKKRPKSSQADAAANKNSSQCSTVAVAVRCRNMYCNMTAGNVEVCANVHVGEPQKATADVNTHWLASECNRRHKIMIVGKVRPLICWALCDIMAAALPAQAPRLADSVCSRGTTSSWAVFSEAGIS